MIATHEVRPLVREIQNDLAPISRALAEMDAALRGLSARTDLGAGFLKSVQAEFVSNRRLKSSVAAAFRLLEEIDDNLFAIDKGYRRPRRARHPIGDLSFMKTAAGRRPGAPPFEDDDDASLKRRTIH